MNQSNYKLSPLDKSYPDIPLSFGVKRIGRGEESKLNDPCVSRMAIEIEVNDSGVYFTCNSLDNVIRLNGSPCLRNFSAQVKTGDHISLFREKYGYKLTRTTSMGSLPLNSSPVGVPLPLVVSSIETQPSVALKLAEEHKKIHLIMQEEYNCTICQEIIVHCMAIPCGHMFCDVSQDYFLLISQQQQDCILDCLSRKKECPTCRVEVPTGVKSAFPLRNIDSTIDRLVSSCSDSGDANQSIRHYNERKSRVKAVVPVVSSLSSKPLTTLVVSSKPTAAAFSVTHNPVKPILPKHQVKCIAYYISGKDFPCHHCHLPILRSSLAIRTVLGSRDPLRYHVSCIPLRNQLATKKADIVVTFKYLHGIDNLHYGHKDMLKGLLVDDDDVVDDRLIVAPIKIIPPPPTREEERAMRKYFREKAINSDGYRRRKHYDYDDYFDDDDDDSDDEEDDDSDDDDDDSESDTKHALSEDDEDEARRKKVKVSASL